LHNQGLFVEYQIADDRVSGYLQNTQELAEGRLAEMREIAKTLVDWRVRGWRIEKAV
jgi:hypothetical protein